jgi:hypothetical protein
MSSETALSAEPTTVEGRGLLNWLLKSLVNEDDRKAARDSIIVIERQAAARSQPATEGLDVQAIPAVLRAAFPERYKVDDSWTLDLDDARRFIAAYAALTATEPAATGERE